MDGRGGGQFPLDPLPLCVQNERIRKEIMNADKTNNVSFVRENITKKTYRFVLIEKSANNEHSFSICRREVSIEVQRFVVKALPAEN